MIQAQDARKIILEIEHSHLFQCQVESFVDLVEQRQTEDDTDARSTVSSQRKLYDKYVRHVQKSVERYVRENVDNQLLHLRAFERGICALIQSSERSVDRQFREKFYDVVLQILEDLSDQQYAASTPVKDSFQYYPDFEDESFNAKIYSKKEFRNHAIPKQQPTLPWPSTEEAGSAAKSLSSRRKTPTQKFVQNYLSPDTPYNGVLLWHGVGVGKTCAALSIAERFRTSNHFLDKKILILVPSGTLEENWRDEIFNLTKEIKKIHEAQTVAEERVNIQCTGAAFLEELSQLTTLSSEKLARAAQLKRFIPKLISKYYEVKSYLQLANEVDKACERLCSFAPPHLHEAKKLAYIQKKFSNRVIIMDEVHVTRSNTGVEKDNREGKRSRPVLEMIMRYSNNTKVVLCTATPMYNVSSEIVWILNLLRWNDRLAPLQESSVFTTKGALKGGSKALDLIRRKSRGYVSYLRSENPFTYPFKLYPSLTLNEGGYKPVLTHKRLSDGTWAKIPASEKVSFRALTLFKNKLSDWQFQQLELLTHQAPTAKPQAKIKSPSQSNTKPPTPLLGDFTNETFDRTGMQGSNIIYPATPTQGQIHTRLPESLFSTNSAGKLIYQPAAMVGLNPTRSFLHRDNIGQYSAKFKNILDSIVRCRGIVFVYSEYLVHGIFGLALALEENGFQRCVGAGKVSNFLERRTSTDVFCSHSNQYMSADTAAETPTFKQAKYIYLDGKTDKRTLNKLVREARGEVTGIKNTRGEYVKVVLGSRVVEQGINLFNVREIHIMDPWYHLNKNRQVTGRGFRNRSHFGLPPEERNVTIYLHSTTFPTVTDSAGAVQVRESYEEKRYRTALLKQRTISRVERALKENAIDCALNKYGNVFRLQDYSHMSTNPLRTHMVNSRGKSLGVVNMEDRNNSLLCDMTSCEYECTGSKSTKKSTRQTHHGDHANEDTYTPGELQEDVDICRDIIRTLFTERLVYRLADIVRKVQTVDSTLDTTSVYLALNALVTEEDIVFDREGNPGTLLSRDGIYIFQHQQLSHPHTPMYYRRLKQVPKYERVSLASLDLPEKLPSTDTQPLPSTTQSKNKNKNKNNDTGTEADPDFTASTDFSEMVGLGQFVEAMHQEGQKYIQVNFSRYPSTLDERQAALENAPEDGLFRYPLPLRSDLVAAYCWARIDRLESKARDIILRQLVRRIVSAQKLEREYVLLHYFQDDLFTESLESFFQYKRRTGVRHSASVESLSKFCVFRTLEPFQTTTFYQYNPSRDTFTIITPLQSELDQMRPLPSVEENVSKFSGFLKSKKNGELALFVTNRLKYQEELNLSGTVRKKNIPKGSYCGTAIGVKNKGDMCQAINELIHFDIYPSVVKPSQKRQSKMSSKQSKKRTESSRGDVVRIPPKVKGKKKHLSSLCEEIEFILRIQEAYKPVYAHVKNSDYPRPCKHFYSQAQVAWLSSPTE